MTTFRTTLLQLADEQDAAERVRLSGLLASELEVAFNRQGNQTQVALSDTEELLLKKIDGLHKGVGDNNILIATFLETFPAQFTTFQQEMRDAAEDNRTRLGKHSAELKGLRDRLDHKRAELDQIHRELDELKAWKQAQERRD